MTMKYGNTDYPTDEVEVRKVLLHIVNKLATCSHLLTTTSSTTDNYCLTGQFSELL